MPPPITMLTSLSAPSQPLAPSSGSASNCACRSAAAVASPTTAGAAAPAAREGSGRCRACGGESRSIITRSAISTHTDSFAAAPAIGCHSAARPRPSVSTFPTADPNLTSTACPPPPPAGGGASPHSTRTASFDPSGMSNRLPSTPSPTWMACGVRSHFRPVLRHRHVHSQDESQKEEKRKTGAGGVRWVGSNRQVPNERRVLTPEQTIQLQQLH